MNLYSLSCNVAFKTRLELEVSSNLFNRQNRIVISFDFRCGEDCANYYRLISQYGKTMGVVVFSVPDNSDFVRLVVLVDEFFFEDFKSKLSDFGLCYEDYNEKI